MEQFPWCEPLRAMDQRCCVGSLLSGAVAISKAKATHNRNALLCRGGTSAMTSLCYFCVVIKYPDTGASRERGLFGSRVGGRHGNRSLRQLSRHVTPIARTETKVLSCSSFSPPCRMGPGGSGAGSRYVSPVWWSLHLS